MLESQLRTVSVLPSRHYAAIEFSKEQCCCLLFQLPPHAVPIISGFNYGVVDTIGRRAS